MIILIYHCYYWSTLQGIINCLLFKTTDGKTMNGSNSSFGIGKQKVLLRASDKEGFCNTNSNIWWSEFPKDARNFSFEDYCELSFNRFCKFPYS